MHGLRAGAVELQTALGNAFALDLPATVTFDFPSINSLATFIATEISEGAAAAGDTPEPAAAKEPDIAGAAAKISKAVQRMLGSAVDMHQPLMDAGLDSLGMCRLAPSLCLGIQKKRSRPLNLSQGLLSFGQH